MTLVHIYTAGWQKATYYLVPGIPRRFTMEPHARMWVDCCKRLRQARFVEVQVYYDMTRARCITGKGCKTHTKASR